MNFQLLQMACGEELVSTEEEEARAGPKAYLEEVLGVSKGNSSFIL